MPGDFLGAQSPIEEGNLVDFPFEAGEAILAAADEERLEPAVRIKRDLTEISGSVLPSR